MKITTVVGLSVVQGHGAQGGHPTTKIGPFSPDLVAGAVIFLVVFVLLLLYDRWF